MRGKSQQYYFPNKLIYQLNLISYHPVTIVKASSGFGKTTAVRQYLQNNSHDASEYWYTCQANSPLLIWNNICTMLSAINELEATRLKNLGIPGKESLMLIPHIIENFHCVNETYVVIDNYELFECDVSHELIKIFSMHNQANLHFIFITKKLEEESYIKVNSSQIHNIEGEDFLFDIENTSKLLRSQGIFFSQEQINKVASYTEGWLAAIMLCINNYKKEGILSLTSGVKQLVETAIWEKLTQEEQHFLLTVSEMDSFNSCQVAFLLGSETIPKNISTLLKANDFITYDQKHSKFVIRRILRDYLHDMFYRHTSVDFQKRVLHLIGQSYAAISEYYMAAQYFLKVKDFDAILSLPANSEYIENQKEKGILEFIRKVVNQCPKETLMKYPFAMLAFCSQMYAGGYFKVYRRLYKMIGVAVEKSSNISAEELNRIKHEFIFFKHYKEEVEVSADTRALHASADKLHHMSTKIPFTFGCPSILFLYWQEVGQLETTIENIERTFPIYRKYMDGHGLGAEIVMRAEASLMRGEDVEAEVLCYKALYQAKSRQQICVCLSAEVVLTRIAVLRGDVSSYSRCIKNIRSYVKNNSSLYVLRMVELCLAAINSFVGIKETAPWLLDMESISKILYFHAIPYAQILYAMQLFYQERYNEFIGLSHAFLDPNIEITGNTCYIMPRIYYNKYLAITYLRMGKPQEAIHYFKKALELSLPDKIYLPLAQNAEMLALIELAGFSLPDQKSLEALKALCIRQKIGSEVIKRELTNKSPLTPREREVALLVKKRYTALEISDKLFISKATVKTIIRNIYSKLDIHSRSELYEIQI